MSTVEILNQGTTKVNADDVVSLMSLKSYNKPPYSSSSSSTSNSLIVFETPNFHPWFHRDLGTVQIHIKNPVVADGRE